MPRLPGRLLRLVLVGILLGGIASALAALVAKRRLVSVGSPDDDDVELVAVFDSLDFHSRARSFRGGSLLAWYSGAQLDLRQARLDPAGADLDVRTIFASSNIVVPDGWQVRLSGPAVFGANVQPAPSFAQEGAPELRVRAVTVFGATSISAKAWEMGSDDEPFSGGPGPGVAAVQDGPPATVAAPPAAEADPPAVVAAPPAAEAAQSSPGAAGDSPTEAEPHEATHAPRRRATRRHPAEKAGDASIQGGAAAAPPAGDSSAAAPPAGDSAATDAG